MEHSLRQLSFDNLPASGQNIVQKDAYANSTWGKKLWTKKIEQLPGLAWFTPIKTHLGHFLPGRVASRDVLLFPQLPCSPWNLLSCWRRDCLWWPRDSRCWMSSSSCVLCDSCGNLLLSQQPRLTETVGMQRPSTLYSGVIFETPASYAWNASWATYSLPL